VRIHFLDNSSKVFLVPGSTPIKDLVLQCVEKAGVQDAATVYPYYALFESRNGGSIDGNLPMDMKVGEVLQIWNDNNVAKTAKFLFMIRLFLPSILGLQFRDVIAHQLGLYVSDLSITEYRENAQVIDNNALHLQFVQSVYNVITGRHPTTPAQALTLGGIHFILKFGRFQAEKHKVGFLNSRIFEFIPIKHLKSSSKSNKDVSASSTTEWEGKLLNEVQRICAEEVLDNGSNGNNNNSNGNYNNRDEDDNEISNGSLLRFRLHANTFEVTAQRRYLDILLMNEIVFGTTFFKVQQRNIRALPETIHLGVYAQGIKLCDKHKESILASYEIEDIYRWGFKPNAMFYYEINPDNQFGTGTFEFETSEGKMISDLLTDYALAFLKEREREEIRAQQLPSKSGGRSANTNAQSKKSPATNTTTNSNNNKNINKTTTNKKGAASSSGMSKLQAVIKIQALFRGFVLRNEWAREDAAILIQSVFRGYKARVMISKIIEQMLQSGQL
jgi:hypothetical protein